MRCRSLCLLRLTEFQKNVTQRHARAYSVCSHQFCSSGILVQFNPRSCNTIYPGYQYDGCCTATSRQACALLRRPNAVNRNSDDNQVNRHSYVKLLCVLAKSSSGARLSSPHRISNGAKNSGFWRTPASAWRQISESNRPYQKNVTDRFTGSPDLHFGAQASLSNANTLRSAPDACVHLLPHSLKWPTFSARARTTKVRAVFQVATARRISTVAKVKYCLGR